MTQNIESPETPGGFNETHYVRRGTTNLFAALTVGTGEVFGECKPTRDGENFLALLKKAVGPHTGKDIYVVLDNLSTHTTPDVQTRLEKNPQIHFHFTPLGSSWLNQIETWFGIITRQSIRRGTFSSVNSPDQADTRLHHALERQRQTVRLDHHCREILAKVRLVETNIKKLVDNNAK